MEISIIPIGNSRGIRLSKTILEKYNFKEKAEIVLEKDQIALKPVRQPRSGWDKAFEKMHKNGDDKLLIDDVFNDESTEEWS